MQDEYVILASWIFAFVALAHLARLAMRWPVVVGTHRVPMFISWIGLVVTGALAAWGGLGFF